MRVRLASIWVTDRRRSSCWAITGEWQSRVGAASVGEVANDWAGVVGCSRRRHGEARRRGGAGRRGSDNVGAGTRRWLASAPRAEMGRCFTGAQAHGDGLQGLGSE
ncbi:hypothetical protein ACJRO7_004816 [Eucalyptus globulus]|uniref:Uncharacterized protein n=1 Tax=Eucalyptus globulus TaxID=34317 RepID=A0ABD3J0W1_EUCGL